MWWVSESVHRSREYGVRDTEESSSKLSQSRNSAEGHTVVLPLWVMMCTVRRATYRIAPQFDANCLAYAAFGHPGSLVQLAVVSYVASSFEVVRSFLCYRGSCYGFDCWPFLPCIRILVVYRYEAFGKSCSRNETWTSERGGGGFLGLARECMCKHLLVVPLLIEIPDRSQQLLLP